MPTVVVVDAASSLPPIGGGGLPTLLSPMYFRRTTPFGSPRNYRRTPRQQTPSRMSPSSSSNNNVEEHYLDDPNWLTDPNIRLWDGTGRRRGVNQGQSWTARLVVANVASFVAQRIFPQYTSWGVKLSHKIMNGQDLYRLVSPQFLHGDFWHLAMNMYSLKNVGPIAEQYIGPGRFIMSYLVAGACGNLLSAFMSPNPALGASGAIFGISGMLLMFLQRNEWLFGQQGMAMQQSVLQNIGMNLLYGFMNPRV
jgi:membrane associated rhomboid family serine protease